MTETTKTVFEKYEVRKTKKQKNAFIDYVKSVADTQGYEFRTEKGYLGAKNIVVGDPDKARVVYTAHYDTCAVLPFPNFITPKNIWIYLLYQIAVCALLMFLPLYALGFAIGSVAAMMEADIFALTPFFDLLEYALLIGILVLLVAGPANKHTANDNTSGVTVLLDLMTAMPTEERSKAAFVFFDLEEAGLFGSAGFASKHKNSMKDKLLVNFDCVSDGENMIFAVNKKAQKYVDPLSEAFADSGDISVEIASKGIFYPSDQANFPCGVGVAACRKKRGILYLGRIHTPRDTVYEQKNIDFLVAGSLNLTKNIKE